jgi:hypothetical protein
VRDSLPSAHSPQPTAHSPQSPVSPQPTVPYSPVSPGPPTPTPGVVPVMAVLPPSVASATAPRCPGWQPPRESRPSTAMTAAGHQLLGARSAAHPPPPTMRDKAAAARRCHHERQVPCQPTAHISIPAPGRYLWGAMRACTTHADGYVISACLPVAQKPMPQYLSCLEAWCFLRNKVYLNILIVYFNRPKNPLKPFLHTLHRPLPCPLFPCPLLVVLWTGHVLSTAIS